MAEASSLSFSVLYACEKSGLKDMKFIYSPKYVQREIIYFYTYGISNLAIILNSYA